VWVLHNEKVTQVSLFSTHVIPDIMARRKATDGEELTEESDLPNVEPLLYIGQLLLLLNETYYSSIESKDC